MEILYVMINDIMINCGVIHSNIYYIVYSLTDAHSCSRSVALKLYKLGTSENIFIGVKFFCKKHF